MGVDPLTAAWNIHRHWNGPQSLLISAYRGPGDIYSGVCFSVIGAAGVVLRQPSGGENLFTTVPWCSPSLL